ncbi:hypothetical protein D3C72_623140 [compost metagenome]
MTYRAEAKPWQLHVAAKLGFEVPMTVITNDPDTPLPAGLGQRVAVKSVDTVLLREGDRIQMSALDRAIDMVDPNGRSLVGDYIDELQFRQALRNGFKSGRAMLNAFVKRAAFIQNQGEGAFALFSPGLSMHLMLRGILTGWNPKTAGKALLDGVGHDTPAEVLATLYVWRARESGVLPPEGSEVGEVIDKASLKELGRRTLMAIQAERDADLAGAPYYWDIMLSWTTLGIASEARAWLACVGQADPHVLAKIAKGVLARSSDAGRNVWFFRGLHDRDFYDPVSLLAACEVHADAATLDEDEKARIIALRDGLREAAKTVKPPAGQRNRQARPKRQTPDA